MEIEGFPASRRSWWIRHSRNNELNGIKTRLVTNSFVQAYCYSLVFHPTLFHPFSFFPSTPIFSFFFFILELYHHNNAREIGPLWWCSSAGLFFNPSEFPLFFFGWYTYFCTLLYASYHSCSIYNWRYPVTRKIMTKILCYCYQE